MISHPLSFGKVYGRSVFRPNEVYFNEITRTLSDEEVSHIVEINGSTVEDVIELFSLSKERDHLKSRIEFLEKQNNKRHFLDGIKHIDWRTIFQYIGILIVVAFLFLLVIQSIVTGSSNLEAKYDEGYSVVYSSGHDAGYADGYKTGFTDGYDASPDY